MTAYSLNLNDGPCSVRSLLKQNGFSLTNCRRIQREGSVCVNDRPASLKSIIYPGDIVTIDITATPSPVIPEQAELLIAYEDEELIVINKPAGVLVHPTVKEGGQTIANFLAYYFAAKGLNTKIHPLYRLDRNTSGLVIFAKKPEIQHQLSLQELQKEYLGLLQNCPPEGAGVIKFPIGRKPGSIIERQVDCVNGKKSLTSYTVLAKYARGACLVKFQLHTGRTHQIRVHSAAIGCPLVGDSLYGEPGPQTRQALHCWRITFRHPLRGSLIKISAPLPQEFLRLLANYR